MLPQQPAMWTAYVDYLRVTHKEGEGCDEAELAYMAAVRRSGADERLCGDRAEPWAWMGYYGSHIGPVAAGRGPQGAILQASGVRAASVCTGGLPWSGCPRIDLQATFWYEADTPDMAKEFAAATVRHAVGRVGRKAAIRLVDGFGDGDTLYVGRRGKESKFLRIYDKWRESKRDDEWLYAWRFEAELTDGYARAALRRLQSTAQTADEVVAILRPYMEERGIMMPQSERMGYLPMERLARPKSDTFKRLVWLQTQVRPAVDKLVAAGVGPDEIKEALGLT